MASPDRKLGLALGAIGLAGLGLVGGGMFLGFASETRRLQDEQKAISSTSVNPAGIENPQSKKIESDLGWSIGKSALGGVIFVGGEGLAVAGAVSIYVNRRRPEPA